MVKFWAKCFFAVFLQTVCRIDTNDMVLESYGKCANFAYRKFFIIPYGLNTNSNTVKVCFERDFVKTFIEMVQIIYHSKATKMRNLVMLNIFTNSQSFKSNFEYDKTDTVVFPSEK